MAETFFGVSMIPMNYKDEVRQIKSELLCFLGHPILPYLRVNSYWKMTHIYTGFDEKLFQTYMSPKRKQQNKLDYADTLLSFGRNFPLNISCESKKIGLYMSHSS